MVLENNNFYLMIRNNIFVRWVTVKFNNKAI